MPTIRAFIFIALIVASGFTLIHHHPPTHEDLLISKNENQKKIVNRNPSSLQKSSILESYEFKRHVKAMLNSEKSSKTFADLQYKGKFNVEWITENSAMISFELENKMNSNIKFELIMDHWAIKEIKSGEIKNENEEDALNVLKDFSTIFAYRSSQDTSGKYNATYSVINDSPFTQQIHKSKINYIQTFSSPITIVSSENKYSIQTQSNQITSAQGKEITKVKLLGKSILITTSEFELVRKSTSIQMTKKIPNETMKEIDLNLLSHYSLPIIPWSNLNASLSEINKLNQNDRLILFRELVKNFKKEPKNLDPFLNWVESNSEKIGIRTFAIGVLATLGSIESQKKLIDWFQQFPESRPIILNAFTTSSAQFSDETKIFLNQLIDKKEIDSNSANGALFAMGAGIKNNNLINQGDSTAEISRLQNLLNTASTSNEKEIVLSAMGNSGSQAFIPLIEKSLEASNESNENVREKAVLALRLMPVSNTAQLVNQAWNDSSIKVKSAAIQVIHFQGEIEAYQGVLNQCVRESPTLKDACLRVLELNQHS